MASALEGIKMIDLSQVAAAPMAARHLADFGAEVIHIENPARGDTWRTRQSGDEVIHSKIGYTWENFNRNKRGMTLNLAHKRGQEVMFKMVEKADVFLTNMMPSDLEKFHIDYDTLGQINPRLVYAALTGYGKKGPDKDLPGFETTAFFARAGISHVHKEPQACPYVPPLASGDNMAALALAMGIMIALLVREKTGVGQEIDVSLLHSGIYAISNDVAGALVTGADRQVIPREEARTAPRNYYKTKDGRWLRAVIHDLHWPRFCRGIGREDLLHDPRFEEPSSRRQNHAALFDILEAVFASRTLDEWRTPLNEANIPWAPLQTLPEVISDPQVRANDCFASFNHPAYGRIEVITNPVKLSRTPERIRLPAPEFNQHTEEILLELGYRKADIAGFKKQGIVA